MTLTPNEKLISVPGAFNLYLYLQILPQIPEDGSDLDQMEVKKDGSWKSEARSLKNQGGKLQTEAPGMMIKVHILDF